MKWPPRNAAVITTKLISISLVLFASLILSAGQAMAQKATDAQLEDALWNCLKQRIPTVERSIGDHTRAFDPESKRNFAWDNDKKAWIDTKTLESICPKTSTDAGREDALWNCLKQRIPTVERSIGDHTRAFDPESKRNFAWDSDKQAWIDTKTLESVCPKYPPKVREPKVSTGYGMGSTDYGTTNNGFAWYGIVRYEYGNFYNWEDVSGNSPTVVNNDVTSTSNGVGGYLGAKLGGLPMWGMVGGYYSTGLETNTMLGNGHRVQGDVNDYAFGADVRVFVPVRQIRIRPWVSLGIFREWNDGDFEEFNELGSSLSSLHRTHTSWTGSYGVGATYWARPRIGIDLGLSYNGQFDSKNADENFRVGIGVVLSGNEMLR